MVRSTKSRITRSLASLGAIAALLSCGEPPPIGNSAPEEQDGSSTLGTHCLKLGLANDGFSAAPPAKVSLFFTVDTCSGQPVSGLNSQSFAVSEDDKPVSVYESQQTIQPRGQKFRLYSLVLLDLSGSLLRTGEFPKLRDAAVSFVNTLLEDGTGHQVAVYGFDGRSGIFPVSPFSTDVAAITAAIDTLNAQECQSSVDCAAFPDRRSCAGWRCVDDSTNLNGAVVQGLDRLDQQLQTDTTIPFRNGALVVFTDGTDQAARVSTAAAKERVQATPHRVFTVALGGEVDESTLRTFGKDGYQPAGNPDELEAAFSRVATRIATAANRFYFLEYCSPKRGGKHTLQITATAQVNGRLLRGSLSREFDATGFTSGCELPGATGTP